MQIYYNRPPALDALKYTEFLEKYNTLSKKPKYYEDNPDAENNVDLDQHFFIVHIPDLLHTRQGRPAAGTADDKQHDAHAHARPRTPREPYAKKDCRVLKSVVELDWPPRRTC